MLIEIAVNYQSISSRSALLQLILLQSQNTSSPYQQPPNLCPLSSSNPNGDLSERAVHTSNPRTSAPYPPPIPMEI
ncbi:hypothetical protein J6590_063954 [Homalodisca vitripennis]|nr:hypothetical protein J6590_063954 [Homalodisca vitripennis]